MARIELEKLREEIIGLAPVYSDGGNSTLVYLQAGEVLDQRVLTTMKKALAQCYAVDLQAQRMQIMGSLGRSQVMPFHLGVDRVFVPLKTRKPVGGHDNVYGYFDVRCIKPITDSGRTLCRVSLTDGRQIEVLSSWRTAEQSRQMGQRLLDMLQGQNQMNADQQAFMHVAKCLLYSQDDIRDIKEILLEIRREQIAERAKGYSANHSQPRE